MYPWWVFIHLVGVLGFLLAHGVSVGVLFSLRGERDPARIRALLALSSQSISAFYWSFLVLLGGGLAAATWGHWWSLAWPWIALGVLLGLTALMYVLAKPYYDRIRRVMAIQASGGAAVGEAEIAAAVGGPVPIVLAATGVTGLVAIIYLMVLKPF
ncbi:MAG: hypothetical protein ABR600_13410 [Actinomycetota bacterium]